MAECLPAFTLVGYRELATGVVKSLAEVNELKDEGRPWLSGDGFEPVFTGGPEVIEPVLAVAIALANDRSDGDARRAQRFCSHRFDMQRALGAFVQRGGEIP